MKRTPLELEYSPSSMVQNFDELIEAYVDKSAEARRICPNLTLSYGSGADELVDIFPGGSAETMHVFIHGGYWQLLSRRHASYPAVGFTRSGTQFAAPGYTLAPNLGLDGIVDQARRSVAFLAAHARTETGAPRSIIVSGSSAGAHLAAMVALADWKQAGFDSSPVAGLVLLSGIYDLQPLVDTYINEKVGLNVDLAWSLSPLNLIERDADPIPMLVAVGEIESDTFKSQTDQFAAAARAAGHRATTLEVANRNHFDIVFDLAAPETSLGAAVVNLEHDAGWP